MRIICLILAYLFIASGSIPSFSQTDLHSMQIMFWNTENFFDTFEDPVTLDDEFTPQGTRGWNRDRFARKLNHVYKVIMSGGWDPPDIIGLCEIENRRVLENLVEQTPLSKFEYHLIHHDSPDLRGIDVALLYKPASFRPLQMAFIPVSGFKQGDDPTRDVLFVKGIVKSGDTLNIFINHWPSRYPGQIESMHKREAAATLLRRQIDSLNRSDPGCKVIIMGDFNDEPWDESISEVLGASLFIGTNISDDTGMNERSDTDRQDLIISGSKRKYEDDTDQKSGFRLPAYPGNPKPILFPWQNPEIQRKDHRDSVMIHMPSRDRIYALIPFLQGSITGTLKYQGRWFLFDQFMVSGGVLTDAISCRVKIISHDFLLEPDEAFSGRKPFRTFNGYHYQEGFSDHLPVVLEIIPGK